MWSPSRQLDWSFTPLEALLRWPADRRAALLHSGRFHPRWARWSILAEPIGAYQFVEREGKGEGRWVGDPDDCPVPVESLSERPFRDLRALQQASGDGLWIGNLSYDLGRWVERLPSRAVDDRQWPIVELGWCPGFLVYDGLLQRWSACGSWRERLPFDLATLSPRPESFHATDPVSTFTRPAYERTIARTIDYIAAGDVFQANIAQRFTADFLGTFPAAHRTLFTQLAQGSPAWYGAYMETQSFDQHPRVIASTSPELFLQVDPHGHVVTRPIKGTRPGYVDPMELLRSEKDTAELNMIVDLLRNDLGRVCSYGSVRVEEARAIESHPTVHHGVATITGTLHPSRDIIDLLRATLPGGSVTGAPKVRAMEIIDELEPVRRGPYCGTIGWFARESACFNIAIRTMQFDPSQQRVDYSVGGGIVADSKPDAEFEETIHKAQAMLRALTAGADRTHGQESVGFGLRAMSEK